MLPRTETAPADINERISFLKKMAWESKHKNDKPNAIIFYNKLIEFLDPLKNNYTNRRELAAAYAGKAELLDAAQDRLSHYQAAIRLLTSQGAIEDTDYRMLKEFQAKAGDTYAELENPGAACQQYADALESIARIKVKTTADLNRSGQIYMTLTSYKALFDRFNTHLAEARALRPVLQECGYPSVYAESSPALFGKKARSSAAPRQGRHRKEAEAAMPSPVEVAPPKLN